MTRWISATAAALGAALALAGTAAADRLVVAFKPRAGAAARTAARRALAAEIVSGRAGSPYTELLSVRGSTAAALARLRRDPAVAYAEPDYRFAYTRQVADPLFHIAWDLLNTGQGGGRRGDDIDVTRAWNLTMGAGVLVGVVDSGVFFGHPDLRGAAGANPGRNVFAGNSDLTDRVGHGTHVAGTIAARADNHVGSAGVAPQASLIVAKVADRSGAPDAGSIAVALGWLADSGARVVNMSIGGPSRSRAVAAAIDSHPGTLYVVAAGNDARNDDDPRGGGDWPCEEPAPNLICVAASDRWDRLTPWSDYGPVSVDLAAPGDNILSTVPPTVSRSGYAIESGTSMAAPHVAAAAALLFAADPAATVADVRGALLAGVARRRAMAGRTVTGGRLDVYRSLELVLARRARIRH